MQFSKSLAAIGATAALALSGCVTDPTTGQQHMSKTAMYGLGAAATCGIVGALTHGGKGARNSALACGAIGAGVGGYMDYQEKLLRDQLAKLGTTDFYASAIHLQLSQPWFVPVGLLNQLRRVPRSRPPLHDRPGRTHRARHHGARHRRAASARRHRCYGL